MCNMHSIDKACDSVCALVYPRPLHQHHIVSYVMVDYIFIFTLWRKVIFLSMLNVFFPLTDAKVRDLSACVYR